MHPQPGAPQVLRLQCSAIYCVHRKKGIPCKACGGSRLSASTVKSAAGASKAAHGSDAGIVGGVARVKQFREAGVWAGVVLAKEVVAMVAVAQI